MLVAIWGRGLRIVSMCWCVCLFIFFALLTLGGVALGHPAWLNEVHASSLVVLSVSWAVITIWALTKLLPNGAKVRLAAAMFELGRCPVCAYKLGGLEADTTECVLCPECGAAWRHPPHPPSNTTSPPHTTTSTGEPPNS